LPALDIVVGRQPIFDRHRSVFGYELLFRTLDGPSAAEAAGILGDQMTAEVIFSSVSIGIDRLVGNKVLFCNASRGVLTGVVPILLPAARTVVEIVESVVPHHDVLAGCARLHDDGFTLALDDVTSVSDVERFSPFASIVKVDLRATESAGLPQLVEYCRRRGMALVAEKVETAEEFDHCVALGFDYFQGFLLARPAEVAGRALDPGRVAQLRLAAHLLDRECPMSQLEDIVRKDPALTLQLLQLAGVGAAGGMRRTVQTVREALVLVGWRRLQSWLSLLLIGGKGQASEEELTTALTRARACELVAQSVDESSAPMAFTAGLVSSFDVLLGVALEDVLDELPLDEDLRRAIVQEEGPLGRLVADVKDVQVGRLHEAVRSGFDDSILSSAALQGLMWAVEMTSTFAEAS